MSDDKQKPNSFNIAENEQKSAVDSQPHIKTPSPSIQGKPGATRRYSTASTIPTPSLPHIYLAVPEDLTESERASPVRLQLDQNVIVYHAPDGRSFRLPTNFIADIRDWKDARQFTVLTWGEKIILAFVQLIRSISQQWITHVLIVLLLFLYTALGGLIFHYVEGPHEIHVKKTLEEARINLTHKIWFACKETNDEDVWYRSIEGDVRQFEQDIVASPIAVDEQQKWNYFGALFFSGTVYTTIGYGNVVPSTDYGRVLTMVYALIGIPLVLMVLADLGKIFTRTIKFVWSFVRRFYFTGSFKRLRSSVPIQAVHRLIPGKKGEVECDTDEANLESSEPDPFVVDEKFDLPVSIALTLLLVYILLGALIMKEVEDNWSYFHAVYFIFVSLTTIGFGDMVPTNPTYLIITFIYLLFGLALTSMCINVVQVSITNTFTNAKNKLALRIGLSENTDNIHSESMKLETNELAPVHGKNKHKSE